MATRDQARAACAAAHPHRRLDLVQHELDGEALIFDPQSKDTHRLNETALFVWRLCDGTNDLSAMAKALAHRYDVDERSAARHVQRLCVELDGLGLLQDRRLARIGEPA
ncbi:MAG: PqqD family protein [Phycisphaerae bacterium]